MVYKVIFIFLLIYKTTTISATHSLKWPSDDDLSGAATALTRIQETYNLDTNDMANGDLNGVTTGSMLSAHDCFELGRQSYNQGDAVHTVQWMKQAIKRWEEEDKKSVDKVIFSLLFYFLYILHMKLNLTG